MNVLLPSRRVHFNEVDSTNTYLKENYRIYKNLSFVDASYQKKGKGTEKDQIIVSRIREPFPPHEVHV